MKESPLPEINEPAPKFCLPDSNENKKCLDEFQGKWVILYFYPKDNTSGCTLEAIDFTTSLDEFKKHNAVIIGVSPDPPESHQKFIEKHGLGILLLSDTEKKVLEMYGVWQKKKMYGREYYGVMRSTVIIDPEGIVRETMYKVRAKGHVEKVLQRLKDLQEE